MARKPKTAKTAAEPAAAPKEAPAVVLSVGELVTAAGGDAIKLAEAFVQACHSPRFKRNSQLAAIARSWEVAQHAARELQARIDERNDGRAERAEAGS